MTPDGARMQELFGLEGRVALITGSSRGIGLALAEALAVAGATVVLNGRNVDALERAADGLRDDGHTVHAMACDVTDPEAVGELVDDIERSVGPLDVLVNNAGIQRRAPFTEFELADWREVLDVNLTSAFICGQAAARKMVERGEGKIINICSVQAQLGRPTIAPYAASKGGLRLLTQGMCADLGPRGIQVNALAPGYFATDLTQALVDDADFSAWVAERTPAGRWGDTSELGGTVVFLASKASSFINGQTIFVDGGMTAVV